MPSDRRNTVQLDGGTGRPNYYGSQRQRESETGISVDRQYDTGYSGTQEGWCGFCAKKKKYIYLYIKKVGWGPQRSLKWT